MAVAHLSTIPVTRAVLALAASTAARVVRIAASQPEHTFTDSQLEPVRTMQKFATDLKAAVPHCAMTDLAKGRAELARWGLVETGGDTGILWGVLSILSLRISGDGSIPRWTDMDGCALAMDRFSSAMGAEDD